VIDPREVRYSGARPSERSRPWWLLLLPASFLLHLAEEWWAGEGFAAWTGRIAGEPVSTARFLVLNGIGWPLFALLTFLAVTRSRPAWFPTAFATAVVINAVLHLLGTLATASYSPGLVTGLLLFLPVGSAALLDGRRRLAPATFGGAVFVGVLIHATVLLVAFG
jgi:hypothetical protein